MNVTPEQLSSLAESADYADNIAHAGNLPMPAAFHKERMQEALAKLAADLKALYAGISGENPWAR